MKELSMLIALIGISLALSACGSSNNSTHTCSLPSYNPWFWNDGLSTGSRQSTNNCYNYANNKVTNSLAQPGRSGGKPFASIACDQVAAAAEADGILPIDAVTDCPNVECKLALVVSPGPLGMEGVDYHWYRRDSNDYWSHKPGKLRATDLDNSGFVIVNPEVADRTAPGTTWEYTDFCGYFCSCSDATEGKGYEAIK